jgi:hypothetical protein
VGECERNLMALRVLKKQNIIHADGRGREEELQR